MSSADPGVLSKQLSGAELVQLRKKAGRSLPVKNIKEFKPSGSWLEEKQIQSSLNETKTLLEEQRAEKQGSLAKAEWNPNYRLAEVTCRVGAQWNTMGHEKRGRLFLFPEEALFLLEMNKLQVYFDGVPMSIQKAYTVLLGSFNGCTVDEYRTYAHLVKQGYILLRHSKNLNVTRYEQKIRLHQYTLTQKHSKGKSKSITNALVNYKGITSSNEINKNTEIVDIIEDVPTKTQRIDHRESNVGATQRLKWTENLEISDKECSNSNTSTERRQVHENIRKENKTDRSLINEMQGRLTSQNDYESPEVETLDYRKPSSNNICPQSTSVDISKNEQNFYRKSSQSMMEVTPVEEENNSFKNKKTDPPSNVKTINNFAKSNASEVAASLQSHTNLSDVIFLDEDVQPSATNRCRQLSESSSSEFGSIKCETPHLKASSKREFVDDEVEVVEDRKTVVLDPDSECEVLEISTSTKKRQKQSPNKETHINVIEKPKDTTPYMKSETKLELENFQSSGVGANQPCSSNIEINNTGKHRITNVQLSDTEIEIVPGVIDKAQENRLTKQESVNDIEVIDLDDDDKDDDGDDDKDDDGDDNKDVDGDDNKDVVGDNDKDVKTSLSKKEEKLRILDSLPSVEGKYLIHVQAPSQDLLPPNVMPQKKDYYIQLWRLNAAGMGGRPKTAENDEQNNSQGQLESQPESRINPWMAGPPEQNIGNMQTIQNTWGTNMYPGANFFINQNLGASPFNMFQAMWHQFASFFPFMNNPMWNVNSFGMQLPWLQPQMNVWRPPWQNRGRPWRRPYRGRARGRYRHQYQRYPVKDHISSSDAETETRNVESNESGGTIPLKLEDNRNVEKNSLPDVIKTKPPNTNDLEENADLVILDDDNDDEPIEISPSTSQGIREGERRNKQKLKRKGPSTSSRHFKPPKKLRGLMEKLLNEKNAEVMTKQEGEEEGVQNAEADKVAERKSLKLRDMKNWKDLKDTVSHVMQEIILDSASSEEEIEEEVDVISDPDSSENQVSSLVQPADCASIDTVLSKLQIISSVDTLQDNIYALEGMLRINFDVYLPNTPFRKASPGLPKYRIAVLGFQERIPSLREVTKLMKQFQDDVPLLFAVVIPDSVTFFQITNVSLPVQVTIPDI